MTEPVAQLNTALTGRYAVDRELAAKTAGQNAR